MANSIAAFSRRVCRSLLSNTKPNNFHQHFVPFCTDRISSLEDSDHDESALNSNSDVGNQNSSSPSSSQDSTQQRVVYDRPLENGLDVGIYKAIMIGQVGQSPVQKKLKSGRTVTLFSIGTGGIRNNRRPLENEEPRDYANRCAVQWHRVSVYPERLGDIAMKHVVPGSIMYLEGNLETKIFTDPITGIVRRVREIAIRRNGRLVFLGSGGKSGDSENTLKGVGYY